jgi:hypothetical protein
MFKVFREFHSWMWPQDPIWPNSPLKNVIFHAR